MVFHITFMLALFHDKKCCNCINFFLFVFLWDLFVMSLVLSLWKLLKKLISRLGTRVVQPTKVRWPAKCTNSWDFECNFYTLQLYYTYPHYPQKWKEAIKYKTLERFLQHTHHFKESYSFLNENFFVKSVLELGKHLRFAKKTSDAWWMQSGGIAGFEG